MYATILYDQKCSLCTKVAHWLNAQPQQVKLYFLPADSPEAKAAFPTVNMAATRETIHVIDEAGRVYVGDDAFIYCLWATKRYKYMAKKLAAPKGRPLTRQVMINLTKYRENHSNQECNDGSCDVAAG